MATGCLICIKKKDNITYIRCNFDGYLRYTGKYLFKYYNTRYKANKLISKGDMMYINDIIKKCCFYNNIKNTTYNPSPRTLNSIVEFKDKAKILQYNYIFLKNRWYVYLYDTFYELTEELLNIESITKENLISYIRIKKFNKLLNRV